MLFQLFHNTAHAGIYRFDCLYSRFHHTCMADHITVCEIADNKIVLIAGDSFHYLVGNLFGTHLRNEVIGGKFFRGRHEAAILSFTLLFNTTVEEESDMCILFRLSNAELFQPHRADQITDCIFNYFRRIGNGESEVFIILCRADIA